MPASSESKNLLSCSTSMRTGFFGLARLKTAYPSERDSADVLAALVGGSYTILLRYPVTSENNLAIRGVLLPSESP